MRQQIVYGEDYLLELPLIDAGAQDFEATPVTAAAGDVKVVNDAQIAANPVAETVAFTSGSAEPNNGDVLTGATSTQTCVFMFAVVTSGTWGAGTAAGFLFVKSASGMEPYIWSITRSLRLMRRHWKIWQLTSLMI